MDPSPSAVGATKAQPKKPGQAMSAIDKGETPNHVAQDFMNRSSKGGKDCTTEELDTWRQNK